MWQDREGKEKSKSNLPWVYEHNARIAQSMSCCSWARFSTVSQHLVSLAKILGRNGPQEDCPSLERGGLIAMAFWNFIPVEKCAVEGSKINDSHRSDKQMGSGSFSNFDSIISNHKHYHHPLQQAKNEYTKICSISDQAPLHTIPLTVLHIFQSLSLSNQKVSNILVLFPYTWFKYIITTRFFYKIVPPFIKLD